MKRFAAVILAVLYISTSAGATVHMHYCMGKLAEWGLGHKESNTCGSCGMKTGEAKEKGCCKDEFKFVKNSTDLKIVESSFQLMGIMGTAFIPEYAELPSIQISSVTEENPVSNAPPRSNAVAVYILHRTFLI